MPSKKLWVSACLASIMLAACSTTPDPEPSVTVTAETVVPTPPETVDEEDVGRAEQATFEYGMKVAERALPESGNIVVSPAAMTYQMSMAASGSACASTDRLEGVVGVPAGEVNETYRELASQLASSETDSYTTFLTGLVIENSTRAGAGSDTVHTMVADYSAPFLSLPAEEMTVAGNQWIADATVDEQPVLPESIPATTDVAIMVNLHYSTTWSEPVTVTTVDFEFSDGHTEPVPAIEVTGATVWEADGGMIIELPTSSPDRTYLYVSDDGDVSDLVAGDWVAQGEGVTTNVVIPTVSTSSTVSYADMDDELNVFESDCETETLLVSQYASYDITNQGISTDQIAQTETPELSPTEPDDVVPTVVDRPFALKTADADTGWTILYAIMSDPTYKL